MGKKLYVGNLSYTVTSSDLEQMLSQHGKVESAEVITDRITGRSKGFGFVEMSSDEEAQAAIDAVLNGQRCGVKFAEGFRQHLGHAYPQDNKLAEILDVIPA